MANINLMYTDLSPDLSKAWDNDVADAKGARAVKNSMLGIIMTKRGSRPFDPNFGSDLSSQLFENMTPLVADTIEKNILSAIRNYEPRVYDLQVAVDPHYDSNALVITIRFSIVDNPDVLEEIKIKLHAQQ